MSKNTAPRPRALIDLDGTVADYDTALREAQVKLLHPNEKPRLEADDEDEFPYVRERRRLIKAQPDWWFNLRPIERGMRAVQIMREVGYRLCVLTRGPKPHPAAWAEKLRWAQKHIPDARVSVTSDEKALVYGRVLMDDWVPYVEPWLKVRPRGLVVLPDQPWNRGFEHPRVVRHDCNDAELRARLIEQRDRITYDDSDEE